MLYLHPGVSLTQMISIQQHTHLRQDVSMVVVVCQLVKETPRLQDEGGQHHLGQVHPRPHLGGKKRQHYA